MSCTNTVILAKRTGSLTSGTDTQSSRNIATPTYTSNVFRAVTGNCAIACNILYSDVLCMTDETGQSKRVVFDIASGSLSKIQFVRRTQHNTNLITSKHELTMQKFCDVCKRINIDPLHAEALPLRIIFMSKSKHCASIVHAYASSHDCADVLPLLDVSGAEVQKHCESLLSSMSDWLVLLQHLQVHAPQHAAVVEAESNPIMQRMQNALLERPIFK